MNNINVGTIVHFINRSESDNIFESVCFEISNKMMAFIPIDNGDIFTFVICDGKLSDTFNEQSFLFKICELTDDVINKNIKVARAKLLQLIIRFERQFGKNICVDNIGYTSKLESWAIYCDPGTHATRSLLDAIIGHAKRNQSFSKERTHSFEPYY